MAQLAKGEMARECYGVGGELVFNTLVQKIVEKCEGIHERATITRI